jgi:APA family basic amino acid/polyamine antiporter
MSQTVGASGNPEALLVRELGVRQLAAGVFNYTVGSGIFALPAFAVALLGSSAAIAYLVCGVVIGLVVLCFAEAGSRVDRTGGAYAYVEVAMGPLIGLVAGALLWLAELTAAAAVATIFAGSVTALTGPVGGIPLREILLVLVFAVLAVVNIRGVRNGARVLEVATVAKLLPLILFVLIGAFFVAPSNLVWTDLPSASKVFGACGILIFAFAGIEGALIPSGEVRDPARTVPRAAIVALAGVTLLYLAIQLVAQGVLGAQLATDKVTPLASAAAVIAGNPGRTVMLLAATISMFGYLSGAVLAAPRCLFAFARDGFLPRQFAAVHPRFRTPHFAIVVNTVLTLALAISGTFARLAILANVTVLLLYMLCALAAWILRRRDVRMAGEPFRMPGGSLVPVLAFGSLGWILFSTVTAREFLAVGGVVVVALVMYGVRALRVGGR